MAMDSVGTDMIDIEEDAKALQANETLRQFEMEMGLGAPEVSAPPVSEDAESEKTIGERETA